MASQFSFLVTTDNHMGYKFDDSLRRKDSFMAFKEALQIARERNVDFILLGGDLFHMNRPNATIEHKCIKILRQHMNAIVDRKQTSFRRIEGEFSHFEHVKYGNFEDPSLTVPYPIMTIHGNHDDPTGPGGKSVVEKLATCGLLNYFGKIKQINNEKTMKIEPIVLEKDSIRLALYGIGFIPDRKLHTAFDQNLVRFKSPPKDTFNILIVHQNRRNYEQNKFIPDSFFPKWFHLIIRGHEHDALLPEMIPESHVNGIVYQPGSTVATSIEIRECNVKQVSIMTIRMNDPRGDLLSRYRMSQDIIDLKCFRRMIFKDIYQKEIFAHIKETDTRRKLTQFEYKSIFRKYVVDCIDRLLEAAEKEIESQVNELNVPCDKLQSGDQMDDDKLTQQKASVYKKLIRFRLPILRLRLEFKNEVEMFDDVEVSSMYYPNQVANRDIIKFRRQKIVENRDGTKANVTFDDVNEDYTNLNDNGDNEFDVGQVEAIDLQGERKDTVDTMILNYFMDKPVSERLKAISLDEYTDAVRSSNEDDKVISKVLVAKKNAMLSDLKSKLTDEKTAALHFSSEAKVHDWFVKAFKGTQEPDEIHVEDFEDEMDDIILLDR